MGKYFVTLSASSIRQPDVNANGPSCRPRQLHLLYLVHDWLHHVRYHVQNEATFSTVTSTMQPFLGSLVAHAATSDASAFRRHQSRIGELLDLWGAKTFFSEDCLSTLQQQVTGSVNSESFDQCISPPVKRPFEINQAKQTQPPYHLPAVHGDPAVAYYDLPASTLMPHIIPNVVMPLNPTQIKPLEYAPGPPDDKLVKALKVFMSDVDSLYDTYGEENDADFDVDEFGQRVLHSNDLATRNREGYYGWSQGFCERMMRQHKDLGRDKDKHGCSSPRRRRARSYSFERSRSRSFTPPSDYSPSARQFRGPGFQRRYRSRSRSDSPRSRSASHGREGHSSPTQRRTYDSRKDRSRSRSYSPPALSQISHPTFPASGPSSGPPPPPPFPSSFIGSELPIPPRPPNYTGPWPPPPPPPPPLNGQASLPFLPPTGFPSLAGTHPPPPFGAHTLNNLASFPNQQQPPPHGYGNGGGHGQGMRR